MMRCGRSLSMAAWTLVAACSGSRNETSRSASAGAEAGAESSPPAAGKDDHGDAIDLSVECERFDEVVAEGG